MKKWCAIRIRSICFLYKALESMQFSSSKIQDWLQVVWQFLLTSNVKGSKAEVEVVGITGKFGGLKALCDDGSLAMHGLVILNTYVYWYSLIIGELIFKNASYCVVRVKCLSIQVLNFNWIKYGKSEISFWYNLKPNN